MKLQPASEFDRDSQIMFLLDYYPTVAATADKSYKLGKHPNTRRGGALKFDLRALNDGRYKTVKQFRAGTIAEGIEKANKWLEKTAADGSTPVSQKEGV